MTGRKIAPILNIAVKATGTAGPFGRITATMSPPFTPNPVSPFASELDSRWIWTLVSRIARFSSS
jgi:hypothetical protein